MEITIWLIEQLRASAFYDPVGRRPQAPNWADLVGRDPEVSSTRAADQEEREEGAFENGRLLIVGKPGRDDLIYGAPSVKPAVDIVPSLGTHDVVFERCNGLSSRWLQGREGIRRIALGVKMTRPEDNAVVAAETLRGLLGGLAIDVDDASDFLYQINRRRPSTVIEDLDINRLAKWSLVSWRLVAVEQKSGKEIGAKEGTGIALELDINTVPERQDVIPAEIVADQFLEFLTLASELVEGGDVR